MGDEIHLMAHTTNSRCVSLHARSAADASVFEVFLFRALLAVLFPQQHIFRPDESLAAAGWGSTPTSTTKDRNTVAAEDGSPDGIFRVLLSHLTAAAPPEKKSLPFEASMGSSRVTNARDVYSSAVIEEELRVVLEVLLQTPVPRVQDALAQRLLQQRLSAAQLEGMRRWWAVWSAGETAAREDREVEKGRGHRDEGEADAPLTTVCRNASKEMKRRTGGPPSSQKRLRRHSGSSFPTDTPPRLRAKLVERGLPAGLLSAASSPSDSAATFLIRQVVNAFVPHTLHVLSLYVTLLTHRRRGAGGGYRGTELPFLLEAFRLPISHVREVWRSAALGDTSTLRSTAPITTEAATRLHTASLFPASSTSPHSPAKSRNAHLETEAEDNEEVDWIRSAGVSGHDGGGARTFSSSLVPPTRRRDRSSSRTRSSVSPPGVLTGPSHAHPRLYGAAKTNTNSSTAQLKSPEETETEREHCSRTPCAASSMALKKTNKKMRTNDREVQQTTSMDSSCVSRPLCRTSLFHCHGVLTDVFTLWRAQSSFQPWRHPAADDPMSSSLEARNDSCYYYSTGCEALDRQLVDNPRSDARCRGRREGAPGAGSVWGGLRSGFLAEVFGEAGSGKTQLLLQLVCMEAARRVSRLAVHAALRERFPSFFAPAHCGSRVDGSSTASAWRRPSVRRGGPALPLEALETFLAWDLALHQGEPVYQEVEVEDDEEQEAESPAESNFFSEQAMPPSSGSRSRKQSCSSRSPHSAYCHEATSAPHSSVKASSASTAVSKAVAADREHRQPVFSLSLPPKVLLYLVAEDMPSVRLSQIAKGCLARVWQLYFGVGGSSSSPHKARPCLSPFTQGLFDVSVVRRVQQRLHESATVEALLDEVLIFQLRNGLEELRDMVRGPGLTSGTGSSDPAGDGKLRALLKATLHQQQQKPQYCTGKSEGELGDASPYVGGHPTSLGLLAIDSLAAAAQQTALEESKENGMSRKADATATLLGELDGDELDGVGEEASREEEKPFRTSSQGRMVSLVQQVGRGLQELSSQWNIGIVVSNQVRSVYHHHHLSNTEGVGRTTNHPVSAFAPAEGSISGIKARANTDDASGISVLPAPSVHYTTLAALCARHAWRTGGGWTSTPLGLSWAVFPHTRWELLRCPSSTGGPGQPHRVEQQDVQQRGGERRRVFRVWAAPNTSAGEASEVPFIVTRNGIEEEPGA